MNDEIRGAIPENMETPDGRPQGSTPPHPHSPRPYDTPIPVARYMVGEPIRA